MYTILENGRDYSINKEQRDILVGKDIIYHCPDCGETFYHANPEISEENFLMAVDLLLHLTES